nr:immunoglobulin light chain junction region [Macaca mulatta]MOX14176.1 immunoglobulin light chain junction region [Macaca mulatta]
DYYCQTWTSGIWVF